MATLINSVKRAIQVLEALADDSGGQGARELARSLDIPRSTVHRILQTLESCGAVVQEPASRLYSLGPAVLQLGFTFVERLDVRTKAIPHLERLRELSGETAGLTVRLGDARAYVELLESDFELKAKPRVGHPYPLYSGAPGRAILAFLPDEEVDRVLERVDLVAFTDNTPNTEEAVWAGIEKTREQGLAYAFEETMLGLNTIAAPIFDHLGRPIASVSISGPVSRFSHSDMEAVSGDVSKSAMAISTELGYRGG